MNECKNCKWFSEFRDGMDQCLRYSRTERDMATGEVVMESPTIAEFQRGEFGHCGAEGAGFELGTDSRTRGWVEVEWR